MKRAAPVRSGHAFAGAAPRLAGPLRRLVATAATITLSSVSLAADIPLDAAPLRL